MKRYSVIWIGVATMITVILLSRFMATASNASEFTFAHFASNIMWNNLVLIYPATIVLIAGYIIERERTDDTLKNILTIPISFRRLLTGKLVAVGCMVVALSAIEFFLTLIVSFLSGFSGFSAAGAVQVIFQMIGTGVYCSYAYHCVYRAKGRQLYGRCWICFLLWLCWNDGVRAWPKRYLPNYSRIDTDRIPGRKF